MGIFYGDLKKGNVKGETEKGILNRVLTGDLNTDLILGILFGVFERGF